MTDSDQQKSEERKKLEAQLFPDGFTLRDEANAIVALAFRNGPIEDLHAGQWSELLSNPELSRITDDEMKMLMIDACEHVAKLLPDDRAAKPAEGSRGLFAQLLTVGQWIRCKR